VDLLQCMFTISNENLNASKLTCRNIVGVHGFPEASYRSSLQQPWPRHVPPTPRLDPSITGPSDPGVVENWDVLSRSWLLLGHW